MAAKKTADFEETFTIVTPEKKPEYDGPMVPVFLPALEENGQGGMKVDQYEHVTIANESKETCWKVLRGEPVEVPVPVYVTLKERYPKI
jgi:hypothetical protein